eukprot:2588334-Rhodomonas_salina.3
MMFQRFQRISQCTKTGLITGPRADHDLGDTVSGSVRASAGGIRGIGCYPFNLAQDPTDPSYLDPPPHDFLQLRHGRVSSPPDFKFEAPTGRPGRGHTVPVSQESSLSSTWTTVTRSRSTQSHWQALADHPGPMAGRSSCLEVTVQPDTGRVSTRHVTFQVFTVATFY